MTLVERLERASDALLNAVDRHAYEIAEPIFAAEREELRLVLAELPGTALNQSMEEKDG